MIKIGSRVRCIEHNFYAEEGEEGTVVYIQHENNKEPFLVEWDNNVGGHNGRIASMRGYDGVQRGKEGHCEWMYDYNIEIIDESIGQIRNIAKSLDGFCDCMITYNDMDGACILMHDKNKFEELSNKQEVVCRYYDTTDEEELIYKEASFKTSGIKVMYLYKYKKEEV